MGRLIHIISLKTRYRYTSIDLFVYSNTSNFWPTPQHLELLEPVTGCQIWGRNKIHGKT